MIFMQLQLFSIMLRSGGCAGQINLETPFSVFQLLVCLDEWGVALSSSNINVLFPKTLTITCHKELSNSSIYLVEFRFKGDTPPKHATHFTGRFALVQAVGLILLGRFSPQTDSYFVKLLRVFGPRKNNLK